MSTHHHSLGLYEYRAYLANELFARSLLRDIRWPLGVTCPRCKSQAAWKMRSDYRCKDCRYHFSVTTGTVFQKSHLAISQWIIIIGLWRVGVNALGIQWAVGCNYRIARHALMKIRRSVTDDPLVQQLLGEIEVDETYYGGKQKGKRGRGARGKTAVVGLKERGGRVKTVVVPNVERSTLHATIERYAQKGSTIYTDGLPAYGKMEQLGYNHVPFDHTIHFIQSDIIHTQGIEGHWGITKPGTKARYRRITKQSLPYYTAENDYKTNHKDFPDFIRLILHKLVRSYP